MNTPSTNIYVRPGSTSYAWNYANTSMPSGAGASAVVAVSFNTASSAGQQLELTGAALSAAALFGIMPTSGRSV